MRPWIVLGTVLHSLFLFVACKVSTGPSVSESELIGHWVAKADQIQVDLVLREDETYTLRHEGPNLLVEQSGNWYVDRDVLTRFPRNCYRMGAKIDCPEGYKDTIEIRRSNQLIMGDSLRTLYQKQSSSP